MKILNFLILTTAVFVSSLPASAGSPACAELFEKSFKVTEFIITIPGKKKSEQYLQSAYEDLASNTDFTEIKTVLLTIYNSGLGALSPEDIKMINRFRQDSSFLRSVFQAATKKHRSPKEFADFVREFGHLKDMVNMDDDLVTADIKARAAARKILKKYGDLELESLLDGVKPASKNSIKKYLKEILKETKQIMAKDWMTIDELHDVRKNLRDVLRYMQVQNEAQIADVEKLNFGANNSFQDSDQIDFLKKLNRKLGDECDEFAEQKISGDITKNKLVQFPPKLRQRVEWFLARYQIEIL